MFKKNKKELPRIVYGVNPEFVGFTNKVDDTTITMTAGNIITHDAKDIEKTINKNKTINITITKAENGYILTHENEMYVSTYIDGFEDIIQQMFEGKPKE